MKEEDTVGTPTAIDELSNGDLRKLAALTAVTEAKLLETWEDDHMLCVSVSFQDQDGKAWELSLWWCGKDTHAAALYGNTKEGAKDLRDYLVRQARGLLEDNPG